MMAVSVANTIENMKKYNEKKKEEEEEDDGN
jgi:hypothetical protein